MAASITLSRRSAPPDGPRSIDMCEQPGRTAATFLCSACGAVKEVDRDGSPVQRKEARFCQHCWHSLTAEEVRLVVCDVELQGVPLS